MDLKRWHDVNGHVIVMVEVIVAKSRSNIEFKTALLKTGDKLIVESTKDYLRGYCLSPDFTSTTSAFPGINLLGVTVKYTAG